MAPTLANPFPEESILTPMSFIAIFVWAMVETWTFARFMGSSYWNEVDMSEKKAPRPKLPTNINEFKKSVSLKL